MEVGHRLDDPIDDRTVEVVAPEQLRRHAAAKQVESAVNVIWKRNVLMTPIGGGVNVEPRRALAATNSYDDKDGTIAKERETIDFSTVDVNRWWWD